MNIITLDFLIENGACKEGINFYRRNNLDGFPIDRLNDIKGDFDGFVWWIKYQVSVVERKFDDKGNKIYHKDSWGDEFHWKYDDKGNRIYERRSDSLVYHYGYDDKGNQNYVKYPSGDEHRWEHIYNTDGNLIYKKDSWGNEHHYGYDDNGNKIYEKDSDGGESHWKYDDIGNVIYVKNPSGYDYEVEYDYYLDGQLKSIIQEGEEVLTIPHFDK
jgi:YD repeat-containing protein